MHFWTTCAIAFVTCCVISISDSKSINSEKQSIQDFVSESEYNIKDVPEVSSHKRVKRQGALNGSGKCPLNTKKVYLNKNKFFCMPCNQTDLCDEE